MGPNEPDWEKATRLFARAIDLAPDERGGFLDETCGRDTPLRRELESLLASHDDARTFFEHVLSDVVAPAFDSLAEEEDPREERRVAHYEIRDRLGAGGMGVVYRAWDTRLEREVALKFLAPGRTGDAEARERLMREARAVSALEHPNICAIHAIDETAQGDVFLAMPLYEGETLRGRIARGPLAIDEVLGIGAQIAEALAHAHAQGITHRDLKPANVLVTREGRVKILDFGIARGRVAEALTQPGAALGTMPYAAPEQARGEVADARSDLWALGVTLYEALTGLRPFTGETDAAVVYAVLERQPEPLAELRPDVPPPVAALVHRLLSKDPADRPPSASGVADALRRPLAAPPRTEPPPPSRPGGGRRALALAAIAAVSLVAIGVLAREWTGGGTASASDGAVAVLPFSVRGDPGLDYLQEGVVHLLSAKLNGAGDLRSIDPHAVLGVTGGVDVIDLRHGQDLAARLGAGRYVLGSVLRVGGMIELTASLYDAAGRSRVRAEAMAANEAELPDALDRLAQELVAGQLDMYGGELSSIAAMTTSSFPALRAYLEGEALLRSGRPAAAVDALERAIALDSTFALAWYRLARAAGWEGPPALNERAAAEGVRWADALPDRYRTLLAGYLAYRTGDAGEAERLYRRVLADYPDDFEALELLGETLFHNNPFFGRPSAEARGPLERAHAIDAGNRELLVHLMDLAAREARATELDALTARYLRAESVGSPPTAHHVYRALRRLAVEGEPDRDAVIADLEAAGPERLAQALARVAPILADLELADQLAARLADPANDARWRFEGHVHRALVATAGGRGADAATHWREAEALFPSRALVHRVLAATAPAAAAPDDALVDLRGRIEAWHPGPDDGEPDGLGPGEMQIVRLYLLGLLDLRLRPERGAGSAVTALGSAAATAPDAAVLAGSLARTLEGHAALDAGYADEALAAFDAARLRLPFHIRERSPILDQQAVRWGRAEALRHLGRPGAALMWYDALHDGYHSWGAPYLGASLVARARILVELGEETLAAEHFRRALDLWRDAEPAWMPAIDSVRTELGALDAR